MGTTAENKQIWTEYLQKEKSERIKIRTLIISQLIIQIINELIKRK